MPRIVSLDQHSSHPFSGDRATDLFVTARLPVRRPARSPPLTSKLPILSISVPRCSNS